MSLLQEQERQRELEEGATVEILLPRAMPHGLCPFSLVGPFGRQAALWCGGGCSRECAIRTPESKIITFVSPVPVSDAWLNHETP